METDPVRLENTRAWLSQATKDLARAKRCLTDEPADTEDAVFHCQQACEKALKAFLTWRDEPFRRTHDLASLGTQCAGLDPSFSEWVMDLDELTSYAWVFRYPTQMEPPSRADAERSMILAQSAVARIIQILPGAAARFSEIS